MIFTKSSILSLKTVVFHVELYFCRYSSAALACGLVETLRIERKVLIWSG